MVFLFIEAGRKRYLSSFLKDFIRVFKKKNIKYLVLLAVVLLLTMLFMDLVVLAAIQKISSPIVLRLIDLGNKFGDGHYLFPLLLVLYTLGVALDKKELRFLAMIALVSAILSGLTGQILKIAFLRARPNVGLGPLCFFDFAGVIKQDLLFTWQYKSFPSGHTTNAFSAVLPFVLAMKNRLIKVALLILPVMTGIARIFYNKHWPSDIIMGVALGVYVSYIIYTGNKDKI
ncbi:MAG: phosphatase PAP2 family protein [Spirochaetes bacterium]|nr:phosphatase PAP2 family protein [Spirochaetota bacterium]